MRKPIDLTGRKFNLWTVIQPASRRRYWLCRCECGNEREVYATNLTGNLSQSCGCIQVRADSPEQDGMSEALRLVSMGVLRVDDDGAIWRVQEMAGGRWRECDPRRAESDGNKGYLRLVLTTGASRTTSVQAHRVVYSVKVGTIPDGMEINHKDLNKANNRPSNLEVVTGVGNVAHAAANGRHHGWEPALRARRERRANAR